MRWLPPLLCCVLAACAADDGTWPSLARRPGEAATMVPRPAANPDPVAPAPAAPPAAPALPPVAVDDVAAQLNTIDRDLTGLETRLAAARTAAEGAVAAARGAKPDSDPWSTAQLELTRYERVGNAIGDTRATLDGAAGRLAAAAASGTDVAALLKITGALVARTDAMAEVYRTSYAAAAGALPQ